MFVCPISTRLVLLFCLIIGIAGKNSDLSNHIQYLDKTVCRTTLGLTKSQQEVCYKLPDVTSVAIEGLYLAIKECQYQLHSYRWNCSSLETKAKNPYTSAIFKKGFKETAFGYAITTAAVVISVAKACSQGKLLSCGCDSNQYKAKGMNQTSSDWKWGGCSHNLQYGMKFSKMFLDKREKAVDFHSKIHLHNNQVGRLAVSKHMQVKCKCHGVSGSCQLRTCWRSSPDLRYVGKVLEDRYRSAVLVDQSNLGNNKPKKLQQKKRREKNKARKKQWTLHGKKSKRSLQYDLLYYEKSPTFCDRDVKLDVPGTSGRLCNRNVTSEDSCQSLCCGRGFHELRRKRTEKCNCKFVWCCNVECDNCEIVDYITVCN